MPLKQAEIISFNDIMVVLASGLMKICTFIEALEDSGIPFSYFPVMIPQARGDQETTPTPEIGKLPSSNRRQNLSLP